MEDFKSDIVYHFSARPGVGESIADELYEDALADVLTLSNRDTPIEAMVPIIKDIMAFRLSTRGAEGIKSESYGGVSYGYEGDYPPRIMRRIRSIRLYRGASSESKSKDD